ncbi:MAG: LamG-like jellyroll fold domain-containing protein [Limisphaerales bacterium]
MTLSFPSPEFDDAVAAVCHGSAAEVEMRALNELLRSDSGARDGYLMRVELHTRLASEPDLFFHSAEPVAGAGRPDFSFGERCRIPSFNREAPRRKRTLGRALALAACFAVLAAGVWGLWLRRTGIRNGATSSAVAMLTRAVDARWGRSTRPPRVGSALEPARLRLESGLAQVVFYSGARVVIEGPTELQLISPTEAVCPAGRLLAEVPPPARGFRLKTAQLNLVDLGTAFGIDVTSGRTEVHVFEGKVEFSAGTAAKLSLDEGRAAVVQGSAPPQLMAASQAAFTSMFELQKLSSASEAIRYDQWRVWSARLSQDPSLVVHLDLENLGDADWTLRNASEKNRSVPDATIVGCQRAEGRWPEKQALEFQSVNDRVLLAAPGQFDSLTLSAWVRLKGLDRQFNSLFMCDGFEPGAIHWLIRNDGVLGLTVKGPGPRNFQILASPPVLTLDKFGMWTHLAVVLDGKARRLVHYVNGSPVAQHTLRLGPPYRLGSAELGNWNPRSGPNPAPSLIRNLSASLDEFELFSRALSDAEIHKLYTEGKPESDT